MTPIEVLRQEEVKAFIRAQASTDVNQLMLNPPSAFKAHIKAIANQILSRQKVKGKHDDWATNYDLIMPPPLSVEQASSASTSHYKQSLISGQHLIDLTGGMGIDCIALSKNFDATTYVEANPDLCALFDHNRLQLDSSIRVVNQEASEFLNALGADPSSITVYIDPARRSKHSERVFHIKDCSPDLLALHPLLAEKSSTVWIKFSPLLDLAQVLRTFKGVEAIHVVSIKNDCKEVLVHINTSSSLPSCEIHCVNLESDQPSYTFLAHGESSATYAELPKQYLYEPNSSIMKAGGFRMLSRDFPLEKLSENTHLFTADNIVPDFPGRVYRIIASADKKTIRTFAPDKTINVVSRNHPLNANKLKQKWNVRDGGEYFLIGFRDKKGKAHQVIAQRQHP